MTSPSDTTGPVRVIGRYALYGEIAAGGMATVHYGRLLGPVGFSRTVAIKRLHPQFAKDPEFVSMFLDEARLAARIRHPNVVPTLDVVAAQGELFLVMEYVQGESLSRLIRSARERSQHIPVRIVASAMCGALHGLHAAHEAKNERGEALDIVHRDISPQNVLVGTDGIARVLDFGVAKAAGRLQTTREGQLKGKLAYMAPEQIQGSVTRQTDVYAAAVVLWEALAGKRLFKGENEAHILSKVLAGTAEPASVHNPEVSPELDEVVRKGLAREPASRYATARDFAVALEKCVGLASPTEVGEWVEAAAHVTLAERAGRIAEIESISTLSQPLAAMQGSIAATSAATLADPPVSQASSISVSSAAAVPQRMPRWIVAVAVAAVVMLVGSLAIVVGVARAPAPGAAPEESIVAPKDSVAPTLDSTAAATASAAPSASSIAAPPTTASATESESASATTKPPPVKRTVHTTTHKTNPAPAPTTTTKKRNCDPPFTLDAAGHKQWKMECL